MSLRAALAPNNREPLLQPVGTTILLITRIIARTRDDMARWRRKIWRENNSS